MIKLSNLFKTEKFGLGIILFGMFLIGIALFFFFYKASLSSSVEIDSGKFGQFGDFIGGIVGSIWALAGVILFYVALTEQRKDFATNKIALDLQVQALNQQITEFEEQRKELTNSRKIYEEQSKTFRTQQFESNFYSLLNVYQGIKNNLNNLADNKDYFQLIFSKIILKFDPAKTIEENNTLIINEYINLFNSNSGKLSHYFKSFFRIIKIIDSNTFLNEQEKVFYSKIVRSQLSDYELLILHYNSLSVYGLKSRSLILNYNLLKRTPLFRIPEFNMHYDIQQTHDLLFFANYLEEFLIKHLEDFYNIENEIDRRSEECPYFKSVIGVYFNEHIEITVELNNDIKQNGIILSEEQFSSFLLNFITNKILISTYLDREKVKLEKFKTEIAGNKIFGVKITSNAKLSINQDKY